MKMNQNGADHVDVDETGGTVAQHAEGLTEADLQAALSVRHMLELRIILNISVGKHQVTKSDISEI